MSTKEKYIDPFTDYGFKKLFGSEVNKDLLIDFLSQLIKEQGKITELTFLPTEQLGPTSYHRLGIFDIYCKNEQGERFIVEMQQVKKNYFRDRTLFYSTFPIQEQALTGDWDFKLEAVYTIGILDFVFDEDKKDDNYMHHEVKLMDTTTKEVFYDKLTFIYLEMPKFKKSEAELETQFDKWLYVIKNLPKFESRPEKFHDKIFDKLFETAELANFNKNEQYEYEKSLKAYRDYYADLSSTYQRGKEEGIIEGKIETAIEMIKDGESNEKIMKFTKLSIEKIEELRKQIND